MVCHYTGKEPSPKGHGKCAHEMYKGALARGTDGRMWVIRADKNGRLAWRLVKSIEKPEKHIKRSSTKSIKSTRSSRPKTTTTATTRRVAVNKRGVVKPKRATTMEEAKRNLKFLQSIDYEHEDFETPVKPAVMFVPQKGIKVRYAKKGARGKKGWIIGQPGASNALGIIYEADYTAPIETFSNSDEEARGWFYEAGGYLVTGSGADPVFEIL